MFAFNQQLWDFGDKIEAEVKPILNTKFDANFKKKDDIWDVLDFHDEDKKIICEIKGRKNNHNQYPTTIIPMNKLFAGFKKIDLGYKVYFVFVFTDKSMYCELTEDLKYEVRMTGTNHIEHACININDLIEVI